MGKLDVGVGDEFPVNEPEPPRQPESEQSEAAAHEEWHRRRDEWREQRRAWRAEWRARKHAFKEDLRHSVDEHFGPDTYARHQHRAVRVLVLIGLGVVAIAVLPFLFLLGFAVAVIAIFAAQLGFFRHHHDEYPRGHGRSDATR